MENGPCGIKLHVGLLGTSYHAGKLSCLKTFDLFKIQIKLSDNLICILNKSNDYLSDQRSRRNI